MTNKLRAETDVKPKMKAEELAIALGVSFKTIAAAKAKPGFPTPQSGVFDVAAVCEWIVATSITKRSKMWTGANRILGAMKRQTAKKNQPDPKFIQPVPRDITTPTGVQIDSDSDGDGDFGSILAKFRATVDYCAMQCQLAASEKNNEGLISWLRTCGQAVEQLRKAEQSVLDIRMARKSLLPRDGVVFSYCQLASNVRAKLQQLPAKLSHELVNVASAGQVQRILDEEIRIVLESLSGNPFGDE